MGFGTIPSLASKTPWQLAEVVYATEPTRASLRDDWVAWGMHPRGIALRGQSFILLASSVELPARLHVHLVAGDLRKACQSVLDLIQHVPKQVTFERFTRLKVYSGEDWVRRLDLDVPKIFG